jgi:hypothetical protein
MNGARANPGYGGPGYVWVHRHQRILGGYMILAKLTPAKPTGQLVFLVVHANPEFRTGVLEVVCDYADHNGFTSVLKGDWIVSSKSRLVLRKLVTPERERAETTRHVHRLIGLVRHTIKAGPAAALFNDLDRRSRRADKRRQRRQRRRCQVQSTA